MSKTYSICLERLQLYRTYRNDVIDHPRQIRRSHPRISRNQTDKILTYKLRREKIRDAFPLLFSIPLYTLITRRDVS